MNQQQVKLKFEKYLALKNVNPGGGKTYKDTTTWIATRKMSYLKYRPIFHPNRLNDLSVLRKNFKDWLVFRNNNSWTNFPRAGYRALDYMEKLANCLKILQDETRPIEKRYDECILGSSKVPFIGPGILTGFLHIIYPEKYAVLNNSTAITINKITDSSHSMSYYNSGIKYANVNTWCKNLAKYLNTDLTTLDGFMWYMATEAL